MPPPAAIAFIASLETLGIKLGLENIQRLLGDLDHPDRAFHAIVIAGTNGKGSVAAMLERALRAAGWRTGRYTSPHLVALNERFAIDGVPVDDDVMESSARRVGDAARRMSPLPTFFEATTAMACDIFRAAGVDVAVIEVGLGGRLDATNALQPIATAITAVDYDHEALLGSTLEAIAREKAGIIKSEIPVVLGPNPANVVAVVRDIAAGRRAPLVEAGSDLELQSTFVDGRLSLTVTTPMARYGPLTLGLRGRHQLDNALVAIRLAEAVDARSGIAVAASAIESGLRDVEWAGRLQLATWQGAHVLIDAAHNPAGARALASYILEVHGRLPLVFAAMADKDIGGILAPLAPAMSSLTLTQPATPRAATLDALDAVARVVAPGVPRRAIASPIAAVDAATAGGTTAAVAGSLYLAGEVIASLS